jgi:hypothetical protein
MRDIIYLLFHLLSTIAKLLRPGGSKTIIAENRTHSGRDGKTPVKNVGGVIIDINSHRWRKHCRGLFQLPMAA